MNIYWRIGWGIGYVLQVLVIEMPSFFFSICIMIRNLILAKYIYITSNRDARDYKVFKESLDIFEAIRERLREQLTEEEIDALGPELIKYFTDDEKKWIKKRKKVFGRIMDRSRTENMNLLKEEQSRRMEKLRRKELYFMNPEKFPISTDKK